MSWQAVCVPFLMPSLLALLVVYLYVKYVLGLIIYRIWSADKEMKNRSITYTAALKYSFITRIFVESATLYTTYSVIMWISEVSSSNVSIVLSDVVRPSSVLMALTDYNFDFKLILSVFASDGHFL